MNDADPGFRYARRRRAERFAARVKVDGRLVCVNPNVTHGTASTYSNWGCRCVPCTQAHRRAVAEKRRRWRVARVLVDGRLVATNPDVRHGSSSTYGQHGCRCAPCTAAHAADQAYTSSRRRARESR